MQVRVSDLPDGFTQRAGEADPEHVVGGAGADADTKNAGEPGRFAWRTYTDEPDLTASLQAALEEFVTYGYHGTTVRSIAERAGLSVPGLYYHHRSKQELLATLLRDSNHDLMWRARAALASAADSPTARLIALVENFALYMAHRRTLAELTREIHSLDQPYRAAHIALRDELENMFRVELENGCATREFDTPDPREAVRAIFGMLRTIADWYRPGGPKDAETVAGEYTGFALRIAGASTAPISSGSRLSTPPSSPARNNPAPGPH
jgi:AcrR family transcriptional regulator